MWPINKNVNGCTLFVLIIYHVSIGSYCLPPTTTTTTTSTTSSPSLSSSSSSSSNLCYLTDNGPSQTFTVNEGLPVNSIIGTLQVSNRCSITTIDKQKNVLFVLPCWQRILITLIINNYNLNPVTHWESTWKCIQIFAEVSAHAQLPVDWYLPHH